MQKLMSDTGPLAVIGAALLCLPCLLVPVLAVLISAGALSAAAGWAGDNALVLSIGLLVAAVALAGAVATLLVRRRRGLVCEPSEAVHAPTLDRRPHPE